MKKAVAISLIIFILLVAAILVFGLSQNSQNQNTAQGTIYQQNKNLSVKDSTQATQTASTPIDQQTNLQTTQSQTGMMQNQQMPQPMTRAS